MNTPEKYRELVDLFNNERYMKTFGFELLGIDSTYAFVRVPLNPEHANFSGILFGGITAMLGDVAAPVIALTKINSAESVIRLHTIETRLLKPILFEDKELLIVAEIAGRRLGKSDNGKHDREKITVITTTYSSKTGEEKALHHSLYDVVPKDVDLRHTLREKNKASRG
jgi:acyl-coenzyme A thioesterase PaaI-like protein